MASCVPSQKKKHRIIADIPCNVDVPVDLSVDVSATKGKRGRPKAAVTCKSAH